MTRRTSAVPTPAAPSSSSTAAGCRGGCDYRRYATSRTTTASSRPTARRTADARRARRSGIDVDVALVVGQSLGGDVGVELAARSPDRVVGLVLSGTSADYRGWLGLATFLAGLCTRLRGAVPPLDRRFRWRVRAALRSKPLPDDVVDAIVAGGISATGYGQGAMAVAGAGSDLRASLRSYEGSVLLPNGAADRLAPTPPDARVQVIADAGHTCSLDRPGAYTSAIREFAGDAVRSGPGSGPTRNRVNEPTDDHSGGGGRPPARRRSVGPHQNRTATTTPTVATVWNSSAAGESSRSCPVALPTK